MYWKEETQPPAAGEIEQKENVAEGPREDTNVTETREDTTASDTVEQTEAQNDQDAAPAENEQVPDGEQNPAAAEQADAENSDVPSPADEGILNVYFIVSSYVF